MMISDVERDGVGKRKKEVIVVEKDREGDRWREENCAR
jgi:hypothetical protein